jgi:DNA-binding Lrp family transcriptional regulator
MQEAEVKKLLEILEKNHNTSLEDLAAMFNSSITEIAAEIKRLQDEKIIVRYHTIVNWEKFGINKVTAVIDVRITPQREVGFDSIAERIYRFPEVRSLYLMSGGYDLLVMLEGQTLMDVASFVSNKLSTIDGILSTTTHFMLKKYKYDGVIIEDEESDHRLVVTP